MDCLRRRLSLAVLAPSILIGMASPLPAGEPLDLVKSAAERAIQVLKDPKLKAPEKKAGTHRAAQRNHKPDFRLRRDGTAHNGSPLAAQNAG